jgi:hypothetical protein
MRRKPEPADLHRYLMLFVTVVPSGYWMVRALRAFAGP